MNCDNPYEVLGLDDGRDVLSCTLAEIRKAYRQLALRWHPDRNSGDSTAASKFMHIFVAYETLSDSTKREQLDNKIRAKRLREQQLNALDVHRRRLRTKLEEREASAAAGTATSTNAQQEPKIDPDVLARMQKEIEQLRSSLASQLSERQSARKHPQSNAWHDVPGYTEFMKAEVPFEEFEKSVLENILGG